jgi:hypothetical protein
MQSRIYWNQRGGMKKSISTSVQQRITANQRRVAGVADREERERELLRQLNRQATEPCKNSIPQNSRY